MDKKRLGGTAAIVMSSIVVSRLTGFAREMLVPNMIGVDYVADAYNYAFRLTGLMYDLLVGGAISAALIPVLSGYIVNKEESDGWKAVGTFINVIVIVMAVICFMGILFAPLLEPFIARASDSEEQVKLTIELTRILLPSVGFLMLAGLSNGVLYSYQRFASAAYGPSIYNIGSALSILFLSKLGVKAVAYGVMVSAFIYFIFQLIFAIKNLKHYRFKIYLKHPGFLRLFKLAIPSLISSAIVQINVVITATFAMFFGDGSVTALNMADRTWQMPYGIFAQGMGIAMLPTLSGYFAKGQLIEYKTTLIKSIKTVLFLTIPAGVGFIVLREEIIRTLFEIKKFDEGIIPLVGNILMFFSIALLSQSIVTIMNRAFYAINDTLTPLLTGLSTIILNVILSMYLRTTGLGVGGMALSYSLVSAVNAFLLLVLLNKKIKGIYLSKLMTFFLKVIPGSFIMGAVVYFTNNIMFDGGSKLMQIISLSIVILVGVAVYFGVVLLFKVEEANYVKDMISKKIRKFI
ncbi:UNVERIFIED_CONTAM: putative peptidoglycan lipid II flippase [Acetivibrio alkalicellulosi]